MTNILQMKEDYKEKLFEKPNVVGVGIGYKNETMEQAIVVMVEKKKPLSALSINERLPISLGVFKALSVPIDVIEVGRLEALAYKDRMRPVQPGISIGHYRITAGTFGAVVYDQFTVEPLLLSNNHVFADSNEGKIGDDILQPGSIDGGNLPQDVIAKLLRFVPIDFGEEGGDCSFARNFAKASNFLSGVLGSQHKVKVIKQNTQAVNYVDAALARPLNMSEIKKEILDIGLVEGTEDYFLGMPVQKTGRTTEHTTGNIILVNATVNVNYGDNKIAKFEDQIISGYMSQGGDSGSLLVSMANKAVGLLFAGSSQSTIYNPISRVLTQLKIRI